MMTCFRTRCDIPSSGQDGQCRVSAAYGFFSRNINAYFRKLRLSNYFEIDARLEEGGKDVYANRRFRAGARGIATALLLTSLAAVVGCVPVAERPPASTEYPIRRSRIPLCGDAISDVESIEIDYATFRPRRVDNTAATVEGLFVLSPGVQFSFSQPPAGANLS